VRSIDGGWYNISVSNWILTVLVLITGLQTAICAVFFCKAAMLVREFIGFIMPVAENELSPAGAVWVNMAKALVQEFKVTMMGLMSVQAKAEKRVENELVQKTIEERSPFAGAAISAFPALRKLFLKNPALVDYAISKLAKVGSPVAAGDGATDSYAARLAKYA
jgi:hypothetical protein